jgi:hypothetical protein
LSLDGELSGKVVVTAPKNLVFYAGDSVELLVGGKIIETKEIKEQNSAVSFVLDTTKLVNGKTIVAVRVTRANGEISTYSSNVTIANGKISAASGAVKRSWLSLTLGILSFIAIAVAIVVLVRWYIQRRQFNEMHNTLDYTYVQPENPYYATAGASMAILVGLSTVLLLGVTQSNAANIGYIYSVAQASGVPTEYSLENDPSTDLDFVRMTDTADNADPGQNVDTGHDTTPSPTPTPTPSPTPTPPPATSADYDSNLAMLLNASSRNKTFDNASRVNVPSASLTNNPALYGDPDEYTGHGAYNPDTIGANSVMFRTECAFSHFSYDDPIVYPNQPGAAHLHVNFGNTHTNAFSTYQTLIDSGNGTCSGMELNRTGYWVPALLDPQGNARVPIRTLMYYKGIGPIVGKIIPYPENIRFLINVSFSIERDISPPWNCNYGAPHGNVTSNCPNNWLHQVVGFPRCLKDNANVIDYATSWVDSTGGWWYSDCPPGSQPLPQLEYNIFYPVDGNEDSSTWFLSSDVDRTTKQQTAANGASSHGDWFGAWNKDINKAFLDKCINNTTVAVNGGDCGFGSLIPCIRANTSLNCEEFAPNMERKALKAITPDPGYIKVPLAQLHQEICPQAPLPATAAVAEYAYCVAPK